MPWGLRAPSDSAKENKPAKAKKIASSRDREVRRRCLLTLVYIFGSNHQGRRTRHNSRAARHIAAGPAAKIRQSLSVNQLCIWQYQVVISVFYWGAESALATVGALSEFKSIGPSSALQRYMSKCTRMKVRARAYAQGKHYEISAQKSRQSQPSVHSAKRSARVGASEFFGIALFLIHVRARVCICALRVCGPAFRPCN